MLLQIITTATQLGALQPEWTDLFRASGTGNPFAHPVWMLTWARHFLRPSQLHVVTVRDDSGTLLGVAPLYRRRHRLGPGIAVTSVQLFGSVEHMALTELTQVLIRPGSERQVLRAVMGHFAEHAEEWDWVEVLLPPEQGWFEPQWLQRGDSAAGFVLHKATRPCVQLPLPGTWDGLRAGLKRNIKESLRHGINSLKRDGHVWESIAPDGPGAVDGALDDLRAVHRARAQLRARIRHPDQLADRAEEAFFRDVARRMFAAGQLTPLLLRIDGATAAARLLLHANGVTYFSLSGFDERWWRHNVATTLTAESLRLALGRGDHTANLSVGVDVSKLRWSERLDLYQEFVVVGARRRSQIAFSLFWQARAAAVILRERGRHART